ncbi:hypothetical protein NPIL_669681 [Nephila pilipes]|uniref:Uncharacterized protein n=1 Tax=Nephila pilipes TaxID=299642 RepID=A0A8X6NLI5_NEPPI|nr:hypothetical protein NPIL_669681 [Nephila pilipes]
MEKEDTFRQIVLDVAPSPHQAAQVVCGRKRSNSSHFLSVRIRRMLRRNSKRCGINNPFIPSPAAVRICHWSKSRRRRRFPRHTCGECPLAPSCRIFKRCITVECIARARNNEIIFSCIDCKVSI